MRPIPTIALYTLLEALRNRLAWLLVATVLAGVGVAGLLGEIAITESGPIQAALLGAFYRFAAVFILAAFVVTSMVREFNDKVLELSLSLPIPRSAYLLGKFAGFAALAALAGLVFGLGLLPYASLPQAGLWTLSLVCELWLVAAFALLCVLTFSQVMPALAATAGFYLLARSIYALQLISHGGPAGDTLFRRFSGAALDAIAALLPRLNEFGNSAWLAYPEASWQQLAPIAGQTLVYLLLLGAAALFDFQRKNL